jgi:hypothetical protein
MKKMMNMSATTTSINVGILEPATSYYVSNIEKVLNQMANIAIEGQQQSSNQSSTTQQTPVTFFQTILKSNVNTIDYSLFDVIICSSNVYLQELPSKLKQLIEFNGIGLVILRGEGDCCVSVAAGITTAPPTGVKNFPLEIDLNSTHEITQYMKDTGVIPNNVSTESDTCTIPMGVKWLTGIPFDSIKSLDNVHILGTANHMASLVVSKEHRIVVVPWYGHEDDQDKETEQCKSITRCCILWAAQVDDEDVYKQLMMYKGSKKNENSVNVTEDRSLISRPLTYSEQLCQVFDNKSDVADVCFMINGKPLHAIKGLLALRNQCFYSMFFGGMLESQTVKDGVTTIVINNSSEEEEGETWSHNISTASSITTSSHNPYFYDSFKAMIEYIMTNQCTINSDIAFQTMFLSKEYLVDELTVICKEFIQGYLTVENVVPIMITCFKKDLNDLLVECLKFTKIKKRLVVRQDNFVDLEAYPQLLMMVTKSFVF